MIDDILDFTKFFFFHIFKDIFFYIFIIVGVILIYELLDNKWNDVAHGTYKTIAYICICLFLLRCYFVALINSRRPQNDMTVEWEGSLWFYIFTIRYLERTSVEMVTASSGIIYILSGIILFFL